MLMLAESTFDIMIILLLSYNIKRTLDRGERGWALFFSVLLFPTWLVALLKLVLFLVYGK